MVISLKTVFYKFTLLEKVLLGICVTLLIIFTFQSVKTKIHDWLVDKKDAEQQQQINQLGTQVVTPALQRAGEAAGSRQAHEETYNDTVRARNTREASAAAARRATEEAERNYETQRKNFSPGSGDIDLRERRAVAAARALYPGTSTYQP